VATCAAGRRASCGCLGRDLGARDGDGPFGRPAVGYFAQIPHYTSGPYPGAAVELLRAVGRHLELEPPLGDLPEEARQLRARLDIAAAADETTRAYVERLEAMVDEERLPSGDDLIADIERFLRDQGGEGGQRGGGGQRG
jgi:hypothetical protein